MAGGIVKYRHLSRNSAHRRALLRNLVTSLVQHESIQTTWPKAKEAQRLAEKLITLGKRNTNAARNRAMGIFFEPFKHMPKLFGELRERYLSRPGGYTRVLRIEPIKEDQAESAILELVDGPKDTRFVMTAKSVAREQRLYPNLRDITAKNVAKVTRYRPEGKETFEKFVDTLSEQPQPGSKEPEIGQMKRRVYPKIRYDPSKQPWKKRGIRQ